MSELVHTRIRQFNTRDTYPDQKLDNDLCQAVVARGRSVFVRGQVGQKLDTSENVGVGDPIAQTEQAMANIAQLLKEAGGELAHICKVTIYLTDPRYREALGKVRIQYINDPVPASTLVVVAGLAEPDYLLEIEGIAVVD